MYKDMQIQQMIKEFGPKEGEMPTVSEENLRFNIARANKAEAQLAEIRTVLRAFGRLLP
jgi:alcohol dehydrogenase class IV